MDASEPGTRKKIGRMVREWIKAGVLKIEHDMDETSRSRPFVVVGDWVPPP